MDLFPRTLRWNLKRALDSGELKPEDDLDDVTDQLTQIFQCDSLDLVELVMTMEETSRSLRTVGELLALLERGGADDVPTANTKK
jgi:acyl carrier protein